LGARPSRVVAAVGPTISRANYEVGADLRDAFIADTAGLDRFFTPAARAGHHMFDLPAFIEHRLTAAGVEAVESLDLCTYAGEDHFFSYRRATHRNEPD